MAPKISIIIPCYNHGHFLREAIESVEKCPRDLWELIVVNDGSTDVDTLRIFDDLRSAGYRIIDQENKGLGAARNTGIAAANGEYILPLDSDNRVRQTYLENAIELLDANAETGVVFGDAEYFGDKKGRWIVPEFDIDRMIVENLIDACAIFRKKAWAEVGGYAEDMPEQGLEDWDFWLTLYERGWKFVHFGGVGFDYRVRGDSMIKEMRKTETLKWIAQKHGELARDRCAVLLDDRRKVQYVNENPLAVSMKIFAKSIFGRRPPL